MQCVHALQTIDVAKIYHRPEENSNEFHNNRIISFQNDEIYLFNFVSKQKLLVRTNNHFYIRCHSVIVHMKSHQMCYYLWICAHGLGYVKIVP